MEPVFFRWNDDVSKLADIDGYFLPGGFSYEDRGRAGMVAARDPLLDFIRSEAASGKPVIGNCNGAQILVESGLIPLADKLHMCLARNVVEGEAAGFISEWVHITPSCAQNRCVTSDWSGVMAMPIAHGEGRFTTKDVGLLEELQKNDQIAFSYCDSEGNISKEAPVTPNGSALAIAGICNPAGNVVALMPHPERTLGGDEYFASMKRWIEKGESTKFAEIQIQGAEFSLEEKTQAPLEIFIDTLIVNNEERTVEQAAKRFVPQIELSQLQYLAPVGKQPAEVLNTISIFNPNKEVAYIRRGEKVFVWNSGTNSEEEISKSPFSGGITLLRTEEPDTGGLALGAGSETGVCYVCKNLSPEDINKREVLEVFANPHSALLSTLT
jgi:phosphoribosylformylglycinamidine synthase I